MSVYTTLDKSKLRAGIANKTLADDMFTKLSQATQTANSVVTVTAAQVLALNATPVELVAAPGAGKALIFEAAVIRKPAGTAYAGIAAGEDLTVKYTNAAGDVQGTSETTGFLDQATNQVRWVRHSGVEETPIENAALVLHLLVGEITTGDSDLSITVFCREIDMAI